MGKPSRLEVWQLENGIVRDVISVTGGILPTVIVNHIVVGNDIQQQPAAR